MSDEQEADGPHYASVIRCAACTHEWVSVYPEAADESELECPSCGSQSSTVIERIPPDRTGPSRVVYGLVMPFWIDTDAYTQRDRDMFVAGVEFEQIRQQFETGEQFTRTIRSENESRVRMMAARYGRRVSIEPSGVEGWSYFQTVE